ncbi:MAG: LLM class flavin-dependent oxidoreductase [Alicyclobacillaceae bacterium]|nr:LLM class flavin-dependent oxidoreductase [Alicyclobacillaceae bacterium]
MKLVYMNIMPYRDLPKDFHARYESSWVTVPSALYDAEQARQMFLDYLDQYAAAVDLGFDGIAFNEHHGSAFGMDNSPNLMAAALARKVGDSERTCLILLGDSLALYQPPLRVAEELAILDVLTQGRLVAGFPLGTSMDTNFVYGIPPGELRPRFYEALDLVKQAWQNRDVFAFNGRFTQLRYVNLWPRPYQQPHPPIWIPGSGSFETWNFCIEHDHPYAYLSYTGHGPAKRFFDAFWEHRDKRGKDVNPHWAGFSQIVLVAESDEKAQELFEEHVLYHFRNLFHIPRKFAEAPGYRNAASVAKDIVEAMGKSRYEMQEVTWKALVDSGIVVAGSPSTVRDRLKEIIHSLRIGNLLMHMNLGSLPHALAMHSIQLFANQVMPHLQSIWNEEWPVVGWPAVAQNAVSAPTTGINL